MTTSTNTVSSMPRIKGSGTLGPVRSLRLPLAIDRWFEERLRDDPDRPASELLLVLIHGGLRLRPGYMRRHREQFLRLIEKDPNGFVIYLTALRDSFGDAYVRHVQDWIADEAPQLVDKNAR